MTGDGSTSDPVVLAYPKYEAWGDELVTALVSVEALPVFDWNGRDGYPRYPGGAGLDHQSTNGLTEGLVPSPPTPKWGQPHFRIMKRQGSESCREGE